MCGIVGAIANRDVVPLLVDGLKRLEYRGYDSAGIAVVAADRVRRVRRTGRVAEMESAALAEDFRDPPAYTGAAPGASLFVRLVLFRADPDLPAADWLIAEPAGSVAFPAFDEFFKRGEPLCGRLQQDKLDALFGARAEQVQSAVLLPIGVGMLAIGSTDPNRFHPGMGTVFLKLIGEAISTAVARFPVA